MNTKEKEALKADIAFRDMMTKKLGKNMKTFFVFFLLFAALAIWGFTGMNDNFLQVGGTARDVIKWVALVLAIITAVLTIMFFLSFQNSKKYVLHQIDVLQGKTSTKK